MENQNNEELVLYCLKGIASNELYPTIALSEEKLKDIYRDLYEYKDDDGNILELQSDDISKLTDLIKIKTKLYNEEKAQGLLDSEKDFAKKVDEKIIEHICEKYYSGYENAEADQKNFKENNIRYDDNGFIEGIKPIGGNNWILDIKDCGSIEYLDKDFSKYLEKQSRENRFANLVIPDDLRNNKAGKEQDLER